MNDILYISSNLADVNAWTIEFQAEVCRNLVAYQGQKLWPKVMFTCLPNNLLKVLTRDKSYAEVVEFPT